MTRRTETLQPDYFDQLYAAKPDPWGFRSSAYEQQKYAETLAALTRPHYPRTLEIGCSIGVFTASLAPRCGSLLAIDASEVALATARHSLNGREGITFEQRVVPNEFPTGVYDLIIVSEVLYYLNEADLADCAKRCVNALASDGEVILCHWLGETDYPLSGMQASEGFAAAVIKQLPTRRILCDSTYRLERYSPMNVAAESAG